MATIKDIARRAGVSHGTVSNVLNGRGNVSSEKILAVQQAASELGYIINQRAKSLREGNSRVLAVMLPNLFDRQYVDFYASFCNYAESQGFRTALYLASNSAHLEQEQLAGIVASRPAGVAAITCYDGNEDIYWKAGFSKGSILYLDHRPNPSCSYIGFDYAECGRALGRMAARFQDVALVTGNTQQTSQRDCLEGFMEEAARHPGCRVSCYEKLGAVRSASTALEILNACPKPEAIFVTNYGLAQIIRNMAQSFFPNHAVQIYTLSPIFTIPERDFEKYELNYRLLGKEAACRLLDMAQNQAKPISLTLPNYGFRSWTAARCSDAESLSIITLDSPTAHILEDMARLYTISTGVKIKIGIFSYDSIHEMLTNMDENTAFDIIRLDATWLNWFAQQVFEPLDQLDPDIHKLLGTFLPDIAPYYGQMPGGLYALPETPSPQMLFYRKDLFEQPIYQRLYKETYQQELRPPQSFAEYNQIARFFSRRFNPGSPVRYGSTLTLGNTGVAATEFLTRYFSLTHTLFDGEDRLRLDSPEALQALNLLIEVQSYAPSSHSNWWRDTAKFFSYGDVAMTVLFSNYASEILGKNSQVHAEIGYAMVPGGNPLLGGGAIGVCRCSRQKKEALNFLRWLCSEEISSAMTLLGSVSPCRKTYENYQVIDMYPWLAMTETCFANSDVRRFPADPAVRFDERRFLSILGLNVLQALNGSLSPQDALKNVIQTYHGGTRRAEPAGL